MRMRKFKQNKLWRDKAVELMEQMGSKIHWTRLEDNEFSEQLKIKFMEEAQEVYNAKTEKALLEELADILEVISSFCAIHEFTLQDIMNVQHKKFQERGGFNGRKFVTIAEHPIESFGEKYCLADVEKYPEITE